MTDVTKPAVPAPGTPETSKGYLSPMTGNTFKVREASSEYIVPKIGNTMKIGNIATMSSISTGIFTPSNFADPVMVGDVDALISTLTGVFGTVFGPYSGKIAQIATGGRGDWISDGNHLIRNICPAEDNMGRNGHESLSPLNSYYALLRGVTRKIDLDAGNGTTSGILLLLNLAKKLRDEGVWSRFPNWHRSSSVEKYISRFSELIGDYSFDMTEMSDDDFRKCYHGIGKTAAGFRDESFEKTLEHLVDSILSHRDRTGKLEIPPVVADNGGYRLENRVMLKHIEGYQTAVGLQSRTYFNNEDQDRFVAENMRVICMDFCPGEYIIANADQTVNDSLLMWQRLLVKLCLEETARLYAEGKSDGIVFITNGTGKLISTMAVEYEFPVIQMSHPIASGYAVDLIRYVTMNDLAENDDQERGLLLTHGNSSIIETYITKSVDGCSIPKLQKDMAEALTIKNGIKYLPSDVGVEQVVEAYFAYRNALEESSPKASGISRSITGNLEKFSATMQNAWYTNLKGPKKLMAYRARLKERTDCAVAVSRNMYEELLSRWKHLNVTAKQLQVDYELANYNFFVAMEDAAGSLTAISTNPKLSVAGNQSALYVSRMILAEQIQNCISGDAPILEKRTGLYLAWTVYAAYSELVATLLRTCYSEDEVFEICSVMCSNDALNTVIPEYLRSGDSSGLVTFLEEHGNMLTSSDLLFVNLFEVGNPGKDRIQISKTGFKTFDQLEHLAVSTTHGDICILKYVLRAIPEFMVEYLFQCSRTE